MKLQKLLIWVSALVFSSAQDFEEISNVPQVVDEINLPSECPKTGKRTKVMYTIEPSDDDTVKVSSFPANLVAADREKGNMLRLTFNEDVAFGAAEGGIRIFFPADQLLTVKVAADAEAQILEGFTGINSIHVSSDGVLQANLLSMNNSTLSSMSLVKVSSNGRATVLSSLPIDNVEASSDAKLTIQAPSVEYLRVSSDAQVGLKGSADYGRVSSDGKLILDGDIVSGRLSSDAVATVTGSVTGDIEMSSDAKLYVGAEISSSASISASSDANVFAPDCAQVSTRSDAKCRVNDGVNEEVVVAFTTMPFTKTGTTKCFTSSRWWQLTVTLLAVSVGLSVCFCAYKKSKKCNNERHGTKSSAPEHKVVVPQVVATAYVVDDSEKGPSVY